MPQFDFDPNDIPDYPVLLERKGVRVLDIGGGLYGLEYEYPGGMTATICYSWPEAEAKFAYRVEEAQSR